MEFKVTTTDLLSDVGRLSAYMSKNIKIDGGSGLDEFCITEDEEDIFDMCVKQTMPYIYDTMSKISTTAYSVSDSNITFTIESDKDDKGNIQTLVEDTIKECLRFGVLAKFYTACTHIELQNAAQREFSYNLELLQQRLFQLKKKTVSPKWE